MTDDELRELTDDQLDQIRFARRMIGWDPQADEWAIFPQGITLKPLEAIAMEREICREECRYGRRRFWLFAIAWSCAIAVALIVGWIS